MNNIYMPRKTKNRKKYRKRTRGGSNTAHTKKRTPFKKLNCSPAVKGKTINEDSCLTKEVLMKLRDSYNKQYPDKKIMSNNHTQILLDLKERMETCSKEDCLFDVIKDVSKRNEIIKQLFAPKQPEEWSENPNTWLSNYDIFDVLKQYEEVYPNFKVIGPTPIDFDSRPSDMDGECVWKELCTFSLDKYLKEGKTKIGVVFNLDKHNQSGSHWVSVFIDLEDDFIFYLDSAGEKIQPQIDAFVKRIIDQGSNRKPPKHIHIYENCPVEHQMGTTECGMYALFFIITMLTNETEGKQFEDYTEKIRFFKDKPIPDKHVEKYREIYFNKN